MGQMEVIRANGSHLNSRNTLSDQFAKWIYEETKDGSVVSKVTCAKQISRLKSGAIVTENQVMSWVCQARRYCEKNLLCTLINIPGEGWRISKKGSGEVEIYFAKSIKKTVAWADRTMDLKAISDRSLMPQAFRTVFYDASGNIKKLSEKKMRMFKMWAGYMDNQKELGENNVKVIESK